MGGRLMMDFWDCRRGGEGRGGGGARGLLDAR